MKLSVLICVHSQDHLHDRLLQRALESLVAQTYTSFSTIIVLDECWEDTVEIVRKYKDVLDIKWFERPKKMGLASAKNFGISKCDGDWIAYLDADDAYHPEKLERQVNFIEENSDYGVVATQACDVYNPGEEDERIEPNCFGVGQYDTDAKIKARLPAENIICHGSVILNAEMIKAHGLYNTSQAFKGQEDYQLWKTLASQGVKFYNIPERLYLYSMNTGVAR